MAKKPSFFDRLTGASFDNEFNAFEEERPMAPARGRTITPNAQPVHGTSTVAPYVEPEGEAQLTVDVYQTNEEIVIRALVAGVKPEDLDISISRDMVTSFGTSFVSM